MPASSFSKNSVAIYSRVSSHQQKDDLDRQSKRLTDFAISNGKRRNRSKTKKLLKELENV